MKPATYSIVIATLGRAKELERTLGTIAIQSRLPELVVIVDASGSDSIQDFCTGITAFYGLPIIYQKAEQPGAGIQRNQGAAIISTPLIAFVDDDMDLASGTCEKICQVFDQDANGKIGGIAARMEGTSHPPPRGILWLYYRLQAGFHHETYGAKLFGPGINCFPCFEYSDAELIPADWLNSACVFFRTPLFRKEKFPDFPGPSFMEDVHLSARIARTHALYFHANAFCLHRDGAKQPPPKEQGERATLRIANQRNVSIEVLGTQNIATKLFFHKLFVSVSILRFQSGSKWESVLGTWRA